jgi:hypothetical protein
MATDHDATETYRLIITRRDASEFLTFLYEQLQLSM